MPARGPSPDGAGVAGMAIMPLVATALVVTSGVLPAFLTGALGVQLKDDLDFGDAGLGAASALFFVGAAATSFGFGRLSERIGPIRSMQASALLSALTLVSVSLLARSWGSLVALLGFGGVANALAQPAANLYLARTVPAHRQGLAFAVKQSAIPFATLLGGLAVPAFALTIGWRWAYVAGGALALLGALLVGRHRGPGPAVPAARPTGRTATGARQRRTDTPMPALVLLTVGCGLGALSANTLGSFLVSAATDSGMAEGSAGVLAAVGSACGLTARVVLGLRADRIGGGHLRTVVTQLVLGAAAFALLSVQEPWALVVGTPVAFAAGWGWAGLFNLAIVLANPRAPGAATGLTQIGIYLGAVIGPVGFGAIADGPGFSASWLAAGVAMVASAVLIQLGGRRIGTPAPA